jgi:hypothetical protein
MARHVFTSGLLADEPQVPEEPKATRYRGEAGGSGPSPFLKVLLLQCRNPLRRANRDHVDGNAK